MDKGYGIDGTLLLVALKLVARSDASIPVRRLADELGLSKSSVAIALRRLQGIGLLVVDHAKRRIHRLALRDCLERAARWAAPAVLGDWELGLPTAHAAPRLASRLRGDEDPVVMPLPHGPVRGHAVTPLHPNAPAAAQRDPTLYELLTVVDALRIGRARDREVAARELRVWL
jgi:DNA-binding Lrp family transcriptional regulator